jgi:ketosteroid isomerase-like protein
MRILATVLAVLALAAPAAAQNLSLRAPQWAQPLIASDIIATLGGRAAIEGEGIVSSARVTIAPLGGGVARVIRFDAREDGASIALRRFTGHPNTGWWLWGPDTPYVSTPTPAQRQELITLTRGASGMASVVGGGVQAQSCASGQQAYIEIFSGGRASSVTRACVAASDAAGQLALRLSEIAGSRNDEELMVAAQNELLAVDRAFSAMSVEEGAPAAFAHYAAHDAVVVANGRVLSGRDRVVASYANWPEGHQLQWTPEAARVSSRGDMGWTHGAYVHSGAGGARETGRYVTVWKRDFDGNWRYAFDAPITTP